MLKYANICPAELWWLERRTSGLEIIFSGLKPYWHGGWGEKANMLLGGMQVQLHDAAGE